MTSHLAESSAGFSTVSIAGRLLGFKGPYPSAALDKRFVIKLWMLA